MSKLFSTDGDVKLFVNGKEIGSVASWSVDVKQGFVDVTSMGSPGRMQLPAQRSVEITLNGVPGFAWPAPPLPDRDIVTHPGEICCCRHCPEGGKHG